MNRISVSIQIRKLQQILAKIFGFWLLLAIALGGGLIAFIDFVGGDITYFSGTRMLSLITFIVAAILAYLVVERVAILDDIRERMMASRAEVYSTRESVYLAATQTMAEISSVSQNERRILLAALHSDSVKRVTKVTHTNPAFEAFDLELTRKIASSGPDMWRVFQLFNITDEDRLKVIIKRLEDAGDAEGFEVRAFSIPNTLAHFSPLIIGDENLFIGVDDPRYYRVSRAIHLHGSSFVEIATEYFDSLWNDPRVFVLRSAVGIEWGNIDKLREKFPQQIISKSENEDTKP